jgi:hypothetical protein
MRLTKTLLGYLNRVFNKDPLAYLAIQLDYMGGMTWEVADGIFTTVVVGGPGQNLTVDLSTYTIGGLVDYLAAQAGYSTPYSDHTAGSNLSALILLDGTGDISLSNGDHLNAYSNVLWAYMEANAAELQLAETQIQNLALEMATTTADSVWLDTLGGYYKVPRLVNELDGTYGPRIIAQVLRPANNNVALEAAIQVYTGQSALVTDVVLPGVTGNVYNGAHVHDGSIFYNAVSTPIYGLFDVAYSYDLINGGDLSTFQATVVGLINTLRAAGTHMRSISLQGSVLADTLTPPTDSFGNMSVVLAPADTLTPPTDSVLAGAALAPFADTLVQPSDSDTLTINYNYTYNGVRTYNGAINHQGGTVGTEHL